MFESVLARVEELKNVLCGSHGKVCQDLEDVKASLKALSEDVKAIKDAACPNCSAAPAVEAKDVAPAE